MTEGEYVPSEEEVEAAQKLFHNECFKPGQNHSACALGAREMRRRVAKAKRQAAAKVRAEQGVG